MAAGLGFKTFTTGEVLTAADTNGYLMQGVLVFASAAARDAAITSPQEGQFAYLKDTNVTTYYTGSAWANLDTTGMTNPMTTTGDMVYSSSGSTPARLGIGTTGQVVTVAGGVPTWATPAGGGGKVLQVVQGTFSTSATSTSSTFADSGLTVNITPTLNTSKVLAIAQVTGSGSGGTPATMEARLVRGATALHSARNQTLQSSTVFMYLDSPATTSSTTYKIQFMSVDNSTSVYMFNYNVMGTIQVLEIGA